MTGESIALLFPNVTFTKTDFKLDMLHCSIAHDLVKKAETRCSAAPAAMEEDENAGPNFLQTLINSGRLSSQRIAAIAAELFIAGIDSVSVPLLFFLQWQQLIAIIAEKDQLGKLFCVCQG